MALNTFIRKWERNQIKKISIQKKVEKEWPQKRQNEIKVGIQPHKQPKTKAKRLKRVKGGFPFLRLVRSTKLWDWK